ncbi:GH25 family lysozyme [Butyrivibrio sp. AE3009]|uniref:GH25 family lysozyme n=1 Tax=Butyrivibrio sp. AE3009 TaxID=1280666 RepID=UPI0003B38C3F|nr:GH25 family lysozyme [Butyrivibrio sp. AE3009]
MKKRLCAALLSCMMLFTGIPVSASEGEYTDFSEEIALEESVDIEEDGVETASFEESTEDYSEEMLEESDEVTTEEVGEEPVEEAVEDRATIDTDRESAWLERYNLTKKEDGNYISVDENGDTWFYDSEDPELLKYFPIEEDQTIVPISPLDEEEFTFLEAQNPDPHVFKLHPQLRVRYPKYYKTDDDSKRVGIRYGIDISKYQKNITKDNFARMKKEFGIDFVIVRAGARGYGSAGTLIDDECFVNNAKNAAAAGLKVGVYIYSQAITEDEAVEEANYCLNKIKDFKSAITLPIYIDYEYSKDPGRLQKAGLSAEQHTAIVNRFCTTIKNSGFLPGIYANRDMLEKDMVLSQIPKTTYIWMANFVKNLDGEYGTSYEGRLETWQVTSSFSFPSGMVGSTYVDFDFWFGDYYRIADSLKYEANGGRGSMSVTKGYQGTEVTVANCSYNNAGHTFVEWNTKADGTGQSYMPGDKYTLTQDNDVLYAIWKIQSYTMTFDSMGGSSVSSITAVYNTLIKKPADPVRQDYIFTGWYKDENCNYEWDFTKDTLRRDTVLYAGWKLDESLDWGDLDLPENADIKAMYASADKVPLEILVYGVPESVNYEGKAITFPGIRVFYGTKQLKLGSDYTVKYKNNVNVGKTEIDKAQLIITGKGNYQKTRIVEFAILPLDITDKLIAPDVKLGYTGKAQKAVTTVSYVKDDKGGTTLLAAGKDFDYIYDEALIGSADEDTEYTVTVKAKGNYTGSGTFTAVILKKETEKVPVSKLKIGKIKAQKLELGADGSVKAAEPVLTVSYNKAAVPLLGDGEDPDADGYVIERYTDNDRAGTASVYIRGTGKYTGERRITFKVTALPMKSVKVEGLKTSFVFACKAITQEGNYKLTYTDAAGTTYELRENEHFTVLYLNNVNAGKNKASITFTGIGAFSGTVKKTFSIEPAVLIAGKEPDPEDVDTYYFTKGGVKPEVKIAFKKDGVLYDLVQGKDYTLKYAGNTTVTKPGKNASVTITGKGNYKGTIRREFKISPENLGALDVYAADVTDKDKAGNFKTSMTITDLSGHKLAAGTDFDKTIIYTYAEDRKIGGQQKHDGDPVLNADIIPEGTRLRASVYGKGNFEGIGSAEFRVVTTSIAKAKVKIADQCYTGRPVEITKSDITSVMVGKNLVLPENYRIVPGSYVANVGKGTAKVTLEGIGNYGGRVVATFKITAKNVAGK